MKKAKLKLYEIINLDIELNGYINPENGDVRVEGLLNQKIPYQTKFNLKSSAKALKIEKDEIDAVQNELIARYGDTDTHGNVGLNRFLEEVDEKGYNKLNPNFVEYQQEWNKFVTENEREIEFYELTLEDLKDVNTKDNYNVIDTYFLKNENE
jgi:hypothetical protein